MAAEHNTNFDTIYNEFNGSISNANISASAAIADTKLASITTAAKVNVSALTVASQATGDLITASSATEWTRVGVGAATTLLHGGSTPSFSALAVADMPAGSVVQVVHTNTTAVATVSTVLPLDDTIPQNTEGDELMTRAITPNSTTNRLIIEGIAYFAGATTAGRFGGAIFQDSTAGALAAGMSGGIVSGGANDTALFYIRHEMAAGTTSSTTFKLRCGPSSAASMFFNGTAAGTRIFGGVCASRMTVWEIKV